MWRVNASHKTNWSTNALSFVCECVHNIHVLHSNKFIVTKIPANTNFLKIQLLIPICTVWQRLQLLTDNLSIYVCYLICSLMFSAILLLTIRNLRSFTLVLLQFCMCFFPKHRMCSHFFALMLFNQQFLLHHISNQSNRYERVKQKN